MAALNFPNSPSTGQSFNDSGNAQYWYFDGVAWVRADFAARGAVAGFFTGLQIINTTAGGSGQFAVLGKTGLGVPTLLELRSDPAQGTIYYSNSAGGSPSGPIDIQASVLTWNSVGLAPTASPTFTGTPAAPTPSTSDNSTKIATTAYVKAQGYATTASPTFSGTAAFATTSWGSSAQILQTGGFMALQPGTGGSFLLNGTMLPNNNGTGVDNTYQIGASGQRWSAVWAATGTIQTSDLRGKVDVRECPFGLEFIKALRPIVYRFADGGGELKGYRKTGQRKIGEREVGTKKVGEIKVGDRKIIEATDLFDENGARLYKTVVTPIIEDVLEPIMEDVMEDVFEPIIERHEGRRTHAGLGAQDVKAVLDKFALGDFAGWVQTDAADPNSEQGLRYEQFIAPLVKAVQELSREVDDLRTQVAALKPGKG